MKGYKKLSIANFNCVFGEEPNYTPMLDYFENIVLEAFLLKDRWRLKKGHFFFYDIKLKETEEWGIYLTGRLIKLTTLEMKSLYNEETEKLIEINKKEDVAPYSNFVLFLKNHRMIFIPNQNGSPTLSNFKKTLKRNMNHIIKVHNNKCELNREYPNFDLDIIEIPHKEEVKSLLKSLEKIESLTIKVAPLNNDIFGKEQLEDLKIQREKSESTSVKQIYNNPKNKEYLENIMIATDGMAVLNIKGKTVDGEKRNVTNGSFKKKIELDLPEHNTEEENENLIINEALKESQMTINSEDNKKTYKLLYGSLKKILVSVFTK